MNKLREIAKDYTPKKEMLRFKNEVWQAKQKWDKREGDTKTNSDKSDKRHKPDKG